MTPKQATLFFVERVDDVVFLNYCARELHASIVEGDLRWRGEEALVWARDVRQTLGGDFVVPREVSLCLGAAPRSAIALEIGQHPSSAYAHLLVATALLHKWAGCITKPGDPGVLSSESLKDDELVRRFFAGHGSRG